MLLGYWNGLSPDLVAWRVRGASPPRRLERLTAERDPKAIVQALHEAKTSRVIVVEPADGPGPWRDSFASECPWVAPTREVISVLAAF